MTWIDRLLGRKKQRPDDDEPEWTLSMSRGGKIPTSPAAYFASLNLGTSDLVGEHQGTHPGHGLTPRVINAIFREAELGYTRLQCDLFEDVIESDGHLRSQIRGRADQVAGKAWILQPGGDRGSDVEAAKQLERACRRVPAFRDMIEHQLTANAYGFAATEIEWDLVNGWWVPVHFANTPHRRFRWDENDDPMIYTQTNRSTGEPLVPGKWILSRLQARNTARAAIMRTATWWSLFKRLSVRDWVLLAERFGIPYITGQWAEQADEQEKSAVTNAVRSLGKDGFAAFSKASEIVIHEMQHSGRADGVHGAIIALCNQEISKLFSGSTLTSDAGGPGSYALGKVHENRSWDVVMNDAERLQTRFQLDVGIPFVVYNQINAEPPALRIHVVRESDPVTRAKVMATVTNELGMPISARQVRQEFQLKEPSGPDDELKGAMPDPAAESKSLPPEQPG